MFLGDDDSSIALADDVFTNKVRNKETMNKCLAEVNDSDGI